MKTTNAVTSADWFRLHGWNAYLLDAAPERQGYAYAKDVGAKFDYGCLIESDDILNEGPPWIHQELPKLSEKYDVVIVDCPGGLNNFTGAVLHRADIALVPTPPGYMDLLVTEWTAKTIKQVQEQRDGGLPKTGIIATRYVKGRKSARTLERKAKDLHFGFVKNGIPEKEQILKARGLPNEDGTGWSSPPMLIWEMGRNVGVRESAKAFDILYSEVFAGANKEDPLKIQRMVTPKSQWNDMEPWHDLPKEDDDTRAAANS